MKFFAIRRDDGSWYVGAADGNPVFSQNQTSRARFREEFVDIRLRGLTSQGHRVEKVPVS